MLPWYIYLGTLETDVYGANTAAPVVDQVIATQDTGGRAVPTTTLPQSLQFQHLDTVGRDREGDRGGGRE